MHYANKVYFRMQIGRVCGHSHWANFFGGESPYFICILWTLKCYLFFDHKIWHIWLLVCNCACFFLSLPPLLLIRTKAQTLLVAGAVAHAFLLPLVQSTRRPRMPVLNILRFWLCGFEKYITSLHGKSFFLNIYLERVIVVKYVSWRP